MDIDFKQADSRALHEPFARLLIENGPRVAFNWLTNVLATQSPSRRSSNSSLVAYTGCPEAIDWLEANVASPVTQHWGSAAALLETPWPRLVNWLRNGGAQRLMALDALIAYRAPAPNMAPLAQIAAPVLMQCPGKNELQTELRNILDSQTTPRVRKTVESILLLSDEILDRRERGVAVSDLPRLYIEPELFPNAGPILARHESMRSQIRKGILNLLNQPKNDEA